MESQSKEEPRKVDASGRLRDEKGHFLPNPDKTCTHGKKPTLTKSDLFKEVEESSLRLRIVKDDTELLPKEFQGRLDDWQEHTASKFIRKVVDSCPMKIEIDNQKYYHAKLVSRLAVALKKERRLSDDGAQLISEIHQKMQEGKEALKSINMAYDRVLFHKTMWKAIAIGLLVGTVILPIGNRLISIAKEKWSSGAEAAVIEQGEK